MSHKKSKTALPLRGDFYDSVPVMDTEPGDIGVAIRQPATVNLLIDSIDRYNEADLPSWLAGANPPGNEFTLQRGRALLNGYFSRVSISQINLDYALPTVLAPGDTWDGNNSFRITNTLTATTSTITITEGYYTAAQLAAAIQLLLRASTAGSALSTCVIDPLTQKVVITNGGDANVLFSLPAAAGPLEQRTYRLLGFNGAGSGPGAAAIAAPRTPVLTYTTYVDMRSEALTAFQRVKDADTAFYDKTAVFARVFLTPPGQSSVNLNGPITLTVDYNTPKNCKWSPNQAIFNLDFTLYDDQGQLLPWSPQWPTEFHLNLLASET
jgi:hypothetical protein